VFVRSRGTLALDFVGFPYVNPTMLNLNQSPPFEGGFRGIKS